MNITLHPHHDLSATEIDAVEDQLYLDNSRAVGRDDAQGLAFVLRDETGRLLGAAAGYSWAATSELSQMWIDPAHRGQGHGRALLAAFLAEAEKRGVKRVWTASYDFQAPQWYEQAGFKRMAELADWPDGHTNVILCKVLISP